MKNKHNFKKLLLLLLLVPMFLKSSVTYEESIEIANKYANKFSDKDKYLLFDNSLYYMYGTNNIIADRKNYKTGGQISKKEFEITINNKTLKTYLANDKSFWTVTNKNEN